MTKEELKKELENINTLYVVGVAISTSPVDRGLWTKFSIYYIKDNKLVRIYINPEEKNIPSYWVPIKKTRKGNWTGGYFECRAIGSDRVFEIIYSLGYWLFNNGYKFDYVFLNSY